MTQADEEAALRKLALEERRARDERELREKELELEREKIAAAHLNARSGASSTTRVALISVASALIGAAASFGAAYSSGLFSVQGVEVEGANAASLAQQKFSFDLINVALAEEDDKTRAQRLRFMVEIGLLNNLKSDKIIEYAKLEEDRIEAGRSNTSLIPKTEPIARVSAIQSLPALPSGGPSGGTGAAEPFELLPGTAVILERPGDKKISVIKEVRALTGLGLKETKDLVETPDAILFSGLDAEKAEGIAFQLTELGASVRLEVVE